MYNLLWAVEEKDKNLDKTVNKLICEIIQKSWSLMKENVRHINVLNKSLN
jgi:hypothetical protein